MTITYQGHIESTVLEVNNKMRMHIKKPMEQGGDNAIVFVPLEQAANWIPGMMVQVTMYTMAPIKSGS